MHPWAIAALGAFFIVTAVRYYLKFLNVGHLKKYGTQIPTEFEGHIDESLLKKTMAYTIENNQFSTISSIFSTIIFLLFLFGGLLNLYNSWIVDQKWSFIISGIFFFLVLSYINTFISIPFDLYDTFKIENKYGFNTQTPKLWILDFVKSLIISTIIMGIIGAGAFWLIQFSQNWWWLFVWGFFFIFSLFMMYISPYIIEPLFNKYEPLKIEGLEDKIKNLMEKAGIKVSRVFQMDASKRSKHTNAYFTGIGRTKRIVLFDTLLQKMDEPEILAVLAHEAGHWKKKHVLKSLVLFEISSLISFYIAFSLLDQKFLYQIFAIEQQTIMAGFILLSFLGGMVSFPFTPLASYYSRRHEYEADRFACELIGNSDGLVSSLIKLSKDNLSNLHPHPVFAAFYYSHPPVVTRIKYLRQFSKTETR
jgi:STE24 endopeptidase